MLRCPALQPEDPLGPPVQTQKPLGECKGQSCQLHELSPCCWFRKCLSWTHTMFPGPQGIHDHFQLHRGQGADSGFLLSAPAWHKALAEQHSLRMALARPCLALWLPCYHSWVLEIMVGTLCVWYFASAETLHGAVCPFSIWLPASTATPLTRPDLCSMGSRFPLDYPHPTMGP